MISRALKGHGSISITALCKQAEVSCSGYYAWLRADKESFDEVDILISKIFKSKRGGAGYRTIKMLLEEKYYMVVNHKRIRRSMRRQGLICVIRRKRTSQVDSVKSYSERAFPNLVARQFSSAKPDMIYSGDVTEFRIARSQKVYLHVAKDLCTKEIVSYNVSTSPNNELVLKDFRVYLRTLSLKVRENLIYHTDQGGVFMSDPHKDITKNLSIKQSMSRRGNCLDNAPVESFFGHLKDEVSIAECKNIQKATQAIDEYIYTYNNKRPQWGLKRKTPAQCRSLYK